MRKLINALGKTHMTSELADFFAEAEISDIVISRKNRAMRIYINNIDCLPETRAAELESAIRAGLPSISGVKAFIRCPCADEDELNVALNKFWPNILRAVGLESPACLAALNGAKWRTKSGRVIISAAEGRVFLLEKKRADKMIEDIMKDMFKQDVRVGFEKIEPTGEYEEHAYKRYEALPENRVRPIFDRKVEKKENRPRRRNGGLVITDKIEGVVAGLAGDIEENAEILIDARVLYVETREIKNGKTLYVFDVADAKGAVTVKLFAPSDKTAEIDGIIKVGENTRVLGDARYDDFSKEIVVMAKKIAPSCLTLTRIDDKPEKRVELHLHTQMSAMDATDSAENYIKRAALWGHKAIAITDHGVVQAFPEAMTAAKKYGVKVIYGMEAYIMDDLEAAAADAGDRNLDGSFVVFDVETTGLIANKDRVIEIGAVKIENGEITECFSSFVNPKTAIPYNITELTGIDEGMVKDAPPIENVLPKFLEFSSGCSFVAHNAKFDMGFMLAEAKRAGRDSDVRKTLGQRRAVADTLELSRALYPKLTRHKLDYVAKHLGVKLKNHHRALDDARAAAEIFIACAKALKEKGVTTLAGANEYAREFIDKSKLRHYHAIILAKNKIGLKNLYELVSKSHIEHLYKRPGIPKSDLMDLREGLILGSACEAGELFRAFVENADDERVRTIAEFYDYLEIQPAANNGYLYRDGHVSGAKDILDINKKIVRLGETLKKPVVATCDAHFLEPEDEIYRRIIMFGEGFKDADKQPPLFYRTTKEMLDEFSYLGEEKAKEIVVRNTNLIADMTEEIRPIPDETASPSIDGAETLLEDITYAKAKEIYGETLPKTVSERLERELGSIIKNGFSALYVIAQKLVWKSVEEGYVVGSRGSVGSSLVATMMGITEVNPLSPHYVCVKCKYSDFDSTETKRRSGGSGCDMPDKNCPVCGEKLRKDGHDIPFETFLGFDGDKEPDIDLNFSGEYQARAHAFAEELFGADNVFKAGTISTLADKTAYGFVMKYLEEKGVMARKAEINRLKMGCAGVKKTTGQHPGGLVILPKGRSVYEFCPVQRPANDINSTKTTTHFDFHSLEGCLLKLDLLGHDAPTIMRILYETSGMDPSSVDLSDERVLSLFNGTEALDISSDDIGGCKTGTLGLPEFGTSFVRGMLMETKPSSFSELVRISGLSHGTDVWTNNAQELVRDKVATLKEIIPTRDDIMLYLISKNVERKKAFKIMERVRKGKGLSEEDEEVMLAAGIDDWYIRSCKKIKYMFPKGHAVAYVMMSVRIGFYKIYYPYSFYAALFSVKAEDFNYETMCRGPEAVDREIARLKEMGGEAGAKEKALFSLLELVREMYARGLRFKELDLYKAQASRFVVTEDGLTPPFCSVEGLGANVAGNIVENREKGAFLSVEDFRQRTKANKNVVDILKRNGVFKDLSETNQLSLF
ncbi:MAG: PolC-type DNA polymerase III [Clostridiales bacterium]|nr:PolC-type DNA polymerase III [Clostridiales bacterium]